MQKNQNKISFAENRLLQKHETLDSAALKQIMKSNVDSIQAETGKQKEFQDAQAADKTKPEAEKTAENTGEDTHEKSLEAMKKLEIAGVIKITQSQLSDLKAEVTRTKNFDKDEALETSEINVIAARIDKLKNDQVKDNEPEPKDEKKAESPTTEPSETLTALGYEKPKTELPEKFEWMNPVEAKPLEANYLKGAKKIWDSSPEDQKDFAEQIKGMEGLGVEIDKSAFENKIIELIATYSQKNFPPDLFTNVVKSAELWNSDKIPKWKKAMGLGAAIGVKIFTLGMGKVALLSAGELGDKMKEIKKELKTKTDALQARLKDPKLQKLLKSQNGALPTYLAKINPEFVKNGKLQPAILDYLLAGNDLINDVILIGVAENWERMKPKFGQLEGFLGKPIDEKASLESLKALAGDPNQLVDFEAKTRKLLDAFELIQDCQFTGTMDKKKMLVALEIKIPGEKVNTVELVQTLPAKVIKLTESLGKVTAITKTINSTLEKIGGKLPGLGSLTDLLGSTPAEKEAAMQEMISNPETLETKILEALKKKFSKTEIIQNAKDLDTLIKSLDDDFKNLDKQLDKTLTKLFTSGLTLTIKGKKGKKDEEVPINFDKEKFASVLPLIKAQLLPILSEAVAKQTNPPLPLLENGEIKIDNLENLAKDPELKLVLDFFSKNKTEEEMKAKLKEDPKTAEAVSKFFGSVFDTIMKSENPEIMKVCDEVAKVAPPKLIEKLSGGVLDQILSDFQKAISKGSIGEMLSALFGLFGKLTSKFNMFWEWGKKQASPMIGKAAEALEKTKNPDAIDFAKKMREWVAPEQPETAAEVADKKVRGNLEKFGFTSEEIDTLKDQPITMGELMSDLSKYKKLGESKGIKLAELRKDLQERYHYDNKTESATNAWEYMNKKETPAAQPAQPAATEKPAAAPAAPAPAAEAKPK
ncbi:MAG: hypothetical protein WC304_01775 [Candidatus Gracilibacteria bacterium]|jgi:hypothetical protein